MDNTKVRLTEKLKAVAFIVLLATSSVFIAAPVFTPKAAAAVAGSVTLSHPTSFWYNSTLRITITDADLAGATSLAPFVEIGITPIGGTEGARKRLNVTQLASGSWVAHIANTTVFANHTRTVAFTGSNYAARLNSTFTVDPVDPSNINPAKDGVVYPTASSATNSRGFYAANSGASLAVIGSVGGTFSAPSTTVDPTVGRLPGYNYVENPGDLMGGRYSNPTVSKAVIQLFNFTKADTVRVYYQDGDPSAVLSASTAYDVHSADVSNERAVVGPANTLFLSITDRDKNRDPTRRDMFIITNNTKADLLPSATVAAWIGPLSRSLSINVISSNTTAGSSGETRNFTRNLVNHTFVKLLETGINTNVFELASGNSSGISLKKFITAGGLNLTQTLRDGDTLQIKHKDGENALSTRTLTLTITRKLGSAVANPATVQFRTDGKVTLTDADANLNAKVKDTVILLIRLNSTLPATTAVVQETDLNTTSFDVSIRATIGNATSGSYSASSNRFTVTVRPGSAVSVNVTYVDPFSGALTTANALLSLATTVASVSLDKASYGTQDLEAVLTIIEPDANDDSAATESIRLTSESTTPANSLAKFGISGTGAVIADFAVVVINGSSSKQGIRSYVGVAIETGQDTGTFRATISLATLRSQLGGLAATDQLRVTYKDRFDNTRVNATAPIGGIISIVSFDRSNFPIVPDKRVNATAFIVDSDLNQNPNSQETITARAYTRNATDGTVGNKANTATDATVGTRKVNYYNISLTETGPNTGNFSLKIAILWGASSSSNSSIANYSSSTKMFYNLDRTQDLLGGRLQVCINDGLGPTTLEDRSPSPLSVKGVCGALTFTVNGATMTANVTSARVGTAVSFTLTEPDQNRDPAVKDVVRVSFEIFRGTTAPVEGIAADVNATLFLTETGVNTGVYTNASQLGTGTSPFNEVNPNRFIKIRYMDDAALGSASITGLVKAKATASIVVGSVTGQTSVIPATETGPFNTIVITVTDADLAFNKTGTPGTDALGRVVLDKVISEVTSDEVNSIIAVKANRTTGSFKFNVTIAYSTSADTTNQVLEVNATDKIHIFYTDRLDSAGTVRIIEKVLNVATRNGVISADKVNYLVNEFITITIADFDANKDSRVREFVRPVVVTDSWTVGTNITLQETAEGSGVFVGQVQVTDSFPGAGQVLGRVGDAVTIRYIDLLGNSGGRTTITAGNIRIGTSLPKTQQVPASAPAVVDAQGRPLAAIRAGDVTTIQATVRNNDTSSHTFTYLVQVKDAGGVVVNLAWLRDITLAAGASTSPGLAWIPSRAGTYTVEVFVWESLANPIALSPAQRITVTVG